MQLSIIIPVYNLEKYIEKCLQSVLIPEVEIIVINDGSNDNSLEIINSFIQKNNSYNFKIIDQKNKGLAETRNVGLIESCGKYIWFVDGDDYIDNLESMNIVKRIKNKEIDVYSLGYNIVDSESEDIIGKIEYPTKQYARLESKLKIIKNPICNVWRYIIRKDFLIENNIEFRKDKLCEDIEWCIKVFSNMKNMDILNVNLYNYRQNRESSIMSNVSLKRMIDVFENIRYSFDYINSTTVNKKVKIILQINLYKQYIYNTYNINLMKKEERIELFNKMGYSSFNMIMIKLLMSITKGYKCLRG